MSGKSKEEIAFEILAKLKGVGIWGENNQEAILDMYSQCLEATSGLRTVDGQTPLALRVAEKASAPLAQAAPPQAQAARPAADPSQAAQLQAQQQHAQQQQQHAQQQVLLRQQQQAAQPTLQVQGQPR